jgi:hypothetical protein
VRFLPRDARVDPVPAEDHPDEMTAELRSRADFFEKGEGAPGERERARVLALLRRYGYNATSFQVLGPGFRYWFDQQGDQGTDADTGCVAFVDTGAAWVAAGVPIAPGDRLSEIAERFAESARRSHRRVCFFGVESRFRPAGFETMLIGEQPVWDPAAWQETQRGVRSIREQLRRARAKGVRVVEVTGAELRGDRTLRRAIVRLVDDWLDTRPMAPMAFVVDVRPFVGAAERRCFAAFGPEGEVLGFLSVAPVFERRGWLVEHLLREPRAPNGTAELLIDALMRAASNDRCPYVTLGLAPLSGPVPRWLRWARHWLTPLYHFEGLYSFKAKLRPAQWDPIFLAYPGNGIAHRLGAVYDTLAAFAGASFIRFGLSTVAHRPSLALGPLAVLLIPWTVLVATASSSWFPAEWVRWGWVVFDSAVAPLLLLLSLRFWRPLGLVLAVLVSGDSILTVVEAMAYNVPRSARVVDALVVAAAFAAPTVTAILLFLDLARDSRSRAHLRSIRKEE